MEQLQQFLRLFIDFQEPVTIVEGIFDAIVAEENSVPILGSSLKEDDRLFYEIVKNNSTVFIALDPDAKKKEITIMEKFLRYGIEIFKINVYPYKDVGEMSRKEFIERKKRAVKMSRESILLHKMTL
jgi:hypothetical protein